MDDLISRSALLADIKESIVFSGRSGETSAEMRGAHKVADRIKAAPTVDAVPVVRCKDCEHYQYGEFFTDIKFCCRLRGENGEIRRYCCSDEDYCSYGIRRSE